MKRNGFTLIELLAVIVVTGLIIAITTPKVLEVLGESKKDTFRLDVAGVIRNLDNQIYNLEIKGENYQGVYTVENGIIKEVNNFNYSIDKTYNGTITITEDKEIGVAIHNDRFCATKSANNPDYMISTYSDEICSIPTPESCFEFDSETGAITNYLFDEGYLTVPSTATTSCEKNVTIPEQIGGLRVKEIGEYSFYDKYIESVTIPNSVTNIKKGAFMDDKLINVNIPDSVTEIGEAAFSYNNIKNINIPDSILVIERFTFAGNDLTSIVIPNSVISIGVGAFESNSLTDIAIPDSVISIGSCAFNNNLLPDEQAFISKPDDSGYLVSYGGAKKDGVIIPNKYNTIGDSSFSYSEITSVIIPNSITTIGKFAFSVNYLSNIIIPNSVTSLGDFSFQANDLTTLVIPSSITNLNPGVFSSNALTSITIPNSVTQIGYYAFRYNNLTNVILPTTVSFISTEGFYKSVNSNSALASIIYNGTTAHDWNNIINGTSGSLFKTGTVINPLGNVIISAN